MNPFFFMGLFIAIASFPMAKADSFDDLFKERPATRYDRCMRNINKRYDACLESCGAKDNGESSRMGYGQDLCNSQCDIIWNRGDAYCSYHYKK